MKKECKCCNIVKGEDDFRTGRSKCKSCENKIRYIQNKQKRESDPEYNKKWKHYDVLRKRRREKENDLMGFIQLIRQTVRKSFKRKGYTKRSKTYSILGENWDTVKLHFESLFKEGMSWDNHGLWEIDHIIPISRANTIDEVEFLCHYTNLQPLWKKENRDKSDKQID